MHSSAGGATFDVARTFVTVQECLKELVLSPSRSVVASCSNAGDGLWIEKNIAVKVNDASIQFTFCTGHRKYRD